MRISLGLIVIVLIGGCASAVPVTRVSVRDAQFDLVKSLSPAELSEFQRQWENKQIVETLLSDVGGEHFKVDIERNGNGDRWLYHSTGHVQLLSKKATPV